MLFYMDNIGKSLIKRKSKDKTASMFKRLFALIIDLIVINIIIVSPFKEILMKFVETTTINFNQVIPSHIYTTITFISIVALLYFAIFQSRMQQTLGMMLLNIKVDKKIGLGKAIVRNLFILPFFPFSLLWIIEPLYLHFRGNRLLENLTHTRTIENG